MRTATVGLSIFFSASRHVAEYVAKMNGEVRASVREWRGAWNRDELESLADRYSEAALLILPEGDPMHGRNPIKQHFEENLPLLGGVQLSQSDFHASGRMAFMSGPFSYSVREQGGTVRQVTGVHVTVFLREGRHWRIRSQIFKAEAN
jgi:ketosteroid isomerase-like protein